MRLSTCRSALATIAVTAGLLGVGANPAQAAAPSQVSRYSKDYVVTLRATGPGVNFQCSNIRAPWVDLVRTPLGTTRRSPWRQFSCTSGDRKVTVAHTITSTYQSDGYARAKHDYTMSWSPSASRIWPSCASGSRDSLGFRTYVTNPVPLTWHYTTSGIAFGNTCGGVSIWASVDFREGWSAP